MRASLLLPGVSASASRLSSGHIPIGPSARTASMIASSSRSSRGAGGSGGWGTEICCAPIGAMISEIMQ